MEKKNNKKGFTLAELLIVVAIIAVLVAVAIPIFNSQLEKSKKAVDEANIRSAYGEAVATYLADMDNSKTGTVSLAGATYAYSVDASDVTTISRTTGSAKSKFYETAIRYDGISFYSTNG